MREGIRLLVIAQVEGFSLSHKIHGICGESDEDNFHEKEIETSPEENKVKIPG